MIYNTPAPISILPKHNPIGNPTPQPVRSGSVLASIISKSAALASKQPEATASCIGCAFHILTVRGELSRRGIVVQETPSTYTVCFVDPLTGIVGNKAMRLKSKTSKWLWFANVEESNAAYFAEELVKVCQSKKVARA